WADRWGRVLPVRLVGPVVAAAIVVGTDWVADSWPLMLPLRGIAFGHPLVSTAASSAESARLVYSLAKPWQNPLTSPQGAAVATIAAQGIGFVVTLGLSLPLLGVGIAAVVIGGPVWGVSTLLLGLLYGALMLYLGVRVGARTYDRRLPELLQQVQSFP